ILRSWKEYDLAVMIINYGKKMLDITSGCKSLFGVTDQEEMPEEVIVLCVSSLKVYLAEFSKRSCSISEHVRKLINF
ncbi:hypothetical protein DBR06_SOUSAS7410067, partial [Sousa chinensis]